MQEKSGSTPKEEITVKIQSLSKTKILREVPSSFEALKQKIQSHHDNDADYKASAERIYSVRYLDG